MNECFIEHLHLLNLAIVLNQLGLIFSEIANPKSGDYETSVTVSAYY